MKLEKMEVEGNDIFISIEKSNELQTSAKRIKECWGGLFLIHGHMVVVQSSTSTLEEWRPGYQNELDQNMCIA